MVGLGNNGDVLACILFGVNGFAVDHNAMATFETLHDDDCGLFAYMKEHNLSNERL